jgi:hypothetical protein
MQSPKFSVVIPAYNGKEYLAEAIQSVLDQTLQELEIIVVDDASPEDVLQVIRAFSDSRVHYIRHEQNLGAVAARKTGANAARGEIIAFLDQDDLFHKQKLDKHLALYLKNPEIGLTYNDRFEVQGAVKTISGIHRAPQTLTLMDLVSGYPISPSDVVIRKEWAIRDEIWNDSFASHAEHVIFNGQEIIFGGRLAFAGCKFGHVSGALNYRRVHPGRTLKHLLERCQAELACQQIIFSDPRCPEDVKAQRDRAQYNIYNIYAYVAFIQQQYDLGHYFLREAMRLQPMSFTGGNPCQFLKTWVAWISAGSVGYGRSPESILLTVLENFPPELSSLRQKSNWVIAQSYLLKGFRAAVWESAADAAKYLGISFERGSILDEAAISMLTDDLLNYGAEFGHEALQKVLDELSMIFARLGKRSEFRKVASCWALNRVFRDYHAGRFRDIPTDVARAVWVDYRNLMNRGMASILLRSLYHQMRSESE